VEEWASQAALDRHLTSSADKTLVAAMESSARPPAIRFDQVEHRAGIEVIEAAHRAQGLLSAAERRLIIGRPVEDETPAAWCSSALEGSMGLGRAGGVSDLTFKLADSGPAADRPHGRSLTRGGV
jgi:hypothetical protein